MRDELDGTVPDIDDPSREERTDFQAFRTVTFHAVVAGLAPLIPVPFLDDWVLGRIRRRMVEELARRQEPGLTAEEVAVLAGAEDRRRRPGCFAGLAWLLGKLTLTLTRKLFRKVLYVLAVREGVHTAARTFHEGYLVLRTLERHPRPDAGTARAATLATLEEIDLRPIRRAMGRAFRGSRELVGQAVAILSRWAAPTRDRDDPAATRTGEATALEREAELLAPLVDRLAARLWGDRAYFEHLGALYAGHLARLGGRRERDVRNSG